MISGDIWKLFEAHLFVPWFNPEKIGKRPLLAWWCWDGESLIHVIVRLVELRWKAVEIISSLCFASSSKKECTYQFAYLPNASSHGLKQSNHQSGPLGVSLLRVKQAIRLGAFLARAHPTHGHKMRGKILYLENYVHPSYVSVKTNKKSNAG